jgi:hypothetical protein
MEDCRIGKEFKESTCRYVKSCRRGWSRNDKFVCRKTTRRLVDTNSPSPVATRVHFENELSPRNNTVRKFTKSKEPKKSGSTRNGTFTPLKTGKLKVGNSFTYTHPDGRKEKVKVTGVGSKGQLEIHIPSLANNVAQEPKFKKNQKVFFIYRTGTKEQGVIKNVYAGEYDVQLLSPPRMKRIKEKNLRAMSDYKLIDTFPYYVLKNA